MCRFFSSASQLAEKSQRALKLLRADPQRLSENRDVILYTRNRVCPDCKREVRSSRPEFAAAACPVAWRYLQGFLQWCPCPLVGVMRFTRFGKLRIEQRALLEATKRSTADHQ